MKPERTFKAGPIQAALWSNQGPHGSFTTVQLTRAYKDREGSVKRTQSFRPADLPRATLVLNKAYEYLAMDSRKDS